MSEEERMYSFSGEEIKELALLFRRCGQKLAPALRRLALFVDRTVCRHMTVEEAEDFFGSAER